MRVLINALIAICFFTAAVAQDNCSSPIQVNSSSLPYTSGTINILNYNNENYNIDCSSTTGFKDIVLELNVTTAPVSLYFDAKGANGKVFFTNGCSTTSQLTCIAPYLQLTIVNYRRQQIDFPVNGIYYIIVDATSSSISNVDLKISQAPVPQCADTYSPENNDSVGYLPVLKFHGDTAATSYSIYAGKIGSTPALIATQADNDNYTFTAPLDTGTYRWYVVPQNACGAPINCVSISDTFIVVAPPAHDSCQGAISLSQTTINDALYLSDSSAFATLSEAPTCTYDSRDMWYKFTATGTKADIRTNLTGSSISETVIKVYEGASCTTKTLLNCYNAQAGNIAVTPGNNYYVSIGPKSTYPNTLNYEIAVTNRNEDDCMSAPMITVNADTLIDTFYNSSRAISSPSGENTVNCQEIGVQAEDDLWFKFVANDVSQVMKFRFTTFPSVQFGTGQTNVYVYGGSCGNLVNVVQCIFGIDGTIGKVAPSTTAYQYAEVPNLVPGNTYYIRFRELSSNNGWNWKYANEFEFGLGKMGTRPLNDSCVTAETLIPSSPGASTTPVFASTAYAQRGASRTHCAPGNTLSQNVTNDIWYKFTATNTEMVVRYENFVSVFNNAIGLNFIMHSGTCSNSPIFQNICLFNWGNGSGGYKYITGLTVGNSYYLDFNTPHFTGATFDLYVYDTALAVPICATLVTPVNNAVLPPYPVAVTLDWNPVPNATSYDVYVGTSVGTAVLVANTLNSSYDYSPPVTGTYYWYVAPKNGTGAATGCSSNAFAFTATGALPLRFDKLYASGAGNVNLLMWKTFSEDHNTDYFSIERSKDGKLFSSIGFVSATGNTWGSKYEFTDKASGNGVTYYRLLIMEKNGSGTYSNIVVVGEDVKTDKLSLVAHPNPVLNRLEVTIAGPAVIDGRLTITDVMGRILMIREVENEKAVLDVSGLPAGFYNLQYSDGTYKESIKIVK